MTHVVNSHFHVDHTGGLRTYVALGAQVVTAEKSAGFIKKLLLAPHTVFPDLLQESPRNASFTLVPTGGRYVCGDPENPMVVHHVTSDHAADMLVAYLPAAKLLFNVDMWAPGQIPSDQPLPAGFYRTGALQLLGAIRLLDLDVETLAGGHGGVGPLGALIPTLERPLRGDR